MLFPILSPSKAAKFYFREARLFIKTFLAKPDHIALNSFEKFGQSKASKCAFVFANGPSLDVLDPVKVADLAVKNDFDIFGVNYFVDTSIFDFANNVSLTLSDPASFKLDSLNPLKMSEWLNTSKLANLYVPSWSKAFLEDAFAKANKKDLFCEFVFNHRIMFFNDSQGSIIFSRKISPFLPRPYISMTAFKALSIAGFLGYKQIYICGFDNTYARNIDNDKENKVFLLDKHVSTIRPGSAYQVGDSKPYYHYHDIGLDVSGVMMEGAVIFGTLKKVFSHLPITNLDLCSLTDAFPKRASLDVFV